VRWRVRYRAGTRGSLAALLGVVAVMGGACATGGERVVRPAPPGAVVGGILEVAIPEPAAIDPGNAFEPMGTMIARLVCDTLLDIDRETGELVPALAESWQVLDGGRRIVLRLREGVRMHDGTELDGQDVVYALSRAASAAFAGQAADLLAPIDGYAVIRGQQETDFAHHRERLRGVRVLSGRTVEVRLSQDAPPQADLVRLFTHPVTAPISSEAAEADPRGFARQPACAGPYRVAAPWEPGDHRLRLERFEDYHASNLAWTRGGAGYADELRFTFTADPRLLAPQAGPPALLDVHLQLLGPGHDRVGGGRRVASAVGASVDYVGLPAGTFPAPVRVALSQALDRGAIADDVFGGERAPATGFLPPTVGAETFRDDACGPSVPTGGDVAAARATLAAAGQDLGARLTIAFNDELRNRDLVEAVAAQWERAFGLTVRLQPLSWAAFLERGAEVEGFDVPFRLSWSAPYPSADPYLFPLFHTAGTGRTNLGGFTDPTFEEALEDAREATEAADRVLAYRALEDRLCDLMPAIPVTFDVVRWAVAAGVEGTGRMLVDPVTAEPMLREVYVP